MPGHGRKLVQRIPIRVAVAYKGPMTASSDNRPPHAVQHPELDDNSIRVMVQTFYGLARQDDLIGPIFNAAVDDWDAHLGKITDFWSSVLLKTGRYSGAPMRPHLVLSLQGAHFDRWLQLFEMTANELFAPDIAALFIARARRMADSFEMGIAAARGEIIGPRHSSNVDDRSSH
jgi:hemoglobin